ELLRGGARSRIHRRLYSSSSRTSGASMLRFAANLGFLFPEHPFLDRFQAARDAGFRAVEFASPYAYGPEEITSHLRKNGLELVLFNFPLASEGKGPAFGLGCRPAR